MSYAHKGTRLMLSGNPITLDFNSAHFDFDNDDSGIVMGELAISNTGSIFTMRPSEGIYGGAISIDVGTTNLFVNPESTSSFSMPDASLTDKIDTSTYHGYAIHHLTRVTGNVQSYCSLRQGVAQNSGNSLSLGFYLRMLSGNINDISPHYGGANQPTAQLVKQYLGTGWYRCTYTSPVATSTATQNIGIGVSGTDYVECLVSELQAEQKSFSTSYVVGTRNSGQLNYNISDSGILDRTEGTLSFYINPQSYTPISSYTDILDIRKGGSTNRFLILRKNGATATLPNVMYIRNANSWTSNSITIPANQWSMLTWSWKDGGQYKMYINGVLKYSGNYIFGDSDFDSIVFNDGGLIDEFVIFTEQKSDDDVLSWYLSNQPFFNPYDGRSWAL